MPKENEQPEVNEHSVPLKAITARKILAESWGFKELFPIGYTDPYRTMDRLCEHLESGGSAVGVSTHPSLEDVLRVFKFYFQWPEIRERRFGGPAAVHQMKLINLFSKPVSAETAPVVTEHSIDNKRKKHKEPYDRITISRYLRGYNNLIIDILGNNGLLIVASQADQAPILKPPEKDPVKVVLDRITKANLQNVLIIPMGFEIEGIEDYSKVRHVTAKRSTYVFHVGKSYTSTELLAISEDRKMTPDYFIYIQQRQLVPPAYRSE